MPRWTRTVNIKTFLDATQPAGVVAKRIRAKLVAAFSVPGFELGSIIGDFEDVQTIEECDDVLERLYDWADANDVWLGLKTN
ncbi:hypothetical protein LCGC14_1131660 [marine sediment metagenome]|uniref:Uncharacterized protein n=1 Tax=marine sediment metagenome TaxID=412755 RepID=A0A0F9Q6N4_9ZZZZ